MSEKAIEILRPAVFVDRDGTLIEDVPYNRDPAAVRVFPGVPEALARLRAAGFQIVMITNQSGIGRGWMTVGDFERVQARVLELLGNGAMAAVYMCPDAPETASARRKPAPGMVLEAASDLRLDLAHSWFIGDKAVDVECGLNSGVRPIQVRTGEGATQRSAAAEYFAEDFQDAAEFIARTAANDGAARQ